ncbi:retrotransposon protein, putative, ty1-copia subclass [Tanacetum coccineum]|uniref:Retrotransposon protein, putative, ty1-copia subclass n=1 Tax=Tanacetum coccineum TaxID=301880 RepID=A0ABQ5B6G7_9ASTR
MREFHACKQEERQSVSSYVLKMNSYIDNLERLGYPVSQNLAVSLILVSLRKEYDSFMQNYNMHGMGKTVNELHAMLKLYEQTLPKKDAHALHVIRAGKVQKKNNKNKKPQLAARGNNQGKGKSKLEYAPKPKIPPPTKKENPAKDLVYHQCGDTGHRKRNFSRNNVVYFIAIPRDGIYEIDLSYSNTNNSSMYAVSNKRVKLNLDSTLLWHCRLGHISKKRIEKLQHDELHNSTDNQSFDKCNPTGYGSLHDESNNSSKVLWDYALESTARILNMVLTKKVEKIPYEVWHGQAPKLSYLKVWGCEALVKRDTLTKPDKLEPRSIKCIFVGYPKETMGYSFYYPPENKVFVARNDEFLENSLITQEASRSLEDLEIIQEKDTHPFKNTSLHHDEEYEYGDLNEPANYKAASLDTKSDKWLSTINVEMQSMKDNKVWDLVDLSHNGKTVGSKWLFKRKIDMDGVVHTYKARLVAKGFTQTYEVDYEKTFSPVADIRAIRIQIAIAVFYDCEIWQMDVKSAFLNGHL